MQNIRVVINVGIILIIVLASITESHIIRKRHDIIESSASIDKINLPVTNETGVTPENDGTFLNDDGIAEDVEDAPRAKNGAYSIETNNVNKVLEKVPSTSDVNNGIEQSFSVQSNDTTAVEIINTSTSPTNFTKDFSQVESIENR